MHDYVIISIIHNYYSTTSVNCRSETQKICAEKESEIISRILYTSVNIYKITYNFHQHYIEL